MIKIGKIGSERIDSVDKQKKHAAFCQKVAADKDLSMRIFWRAIRKACIEENLGHYTETRHVDAQGRIVVRYDVELNREALQDAPPPPSTASFSKCGGWAMAGT